MEAGTWQFVGLGLSANAMSMSVVEVAGGVLHEGPIYMLDPK